MHFLTEFTRPVLKTEFLDLSGLQPLHRKSKHKHHGLTAVCLAEVSDDKQVKCEDDPQGFVFMLSVKTRALFIPEQGNLHSYRSRKALRSCTV